MFDISFAPFVTLFDAILDLFTPYACGHDFLRTIKDRKERRYRVSHRKVSDTINETHYE